MGEEAGIYETEDAKILRRVWSARGMVVDPGLHAFHWTRQQAIDYLVSTGRFDAKGADDLVDRIAVMPGQLTSYDSGGLEIKSLRAEAQKAFFPVALGTLLLLWCVRVFYVAGRGTLASWAPPQQLVTTGPYRHSRNPMYVAVALILVGWAVSFRSAALVFYCVAVVTVFHLRVVFW